MDNKTNTENIFNIPDFLLSPDIENVKLGLILFENINFYHTKASILDIFFRRLITNHFNGEKYLKKIHDKSQMGIWKLKSLKKALLPSFDDVYHDELILDLKIILEHSENISTELILEDNIIISIKFIEALAYKRINGSFGYGILCKDFSTEKFTVGFDDLSTKIKICTKKYNIPLIENFHNILDLKNIIL